MTVELLGALLLLAAGGGAVSPPGQQPSSLCDLSVCQCPLGAKLVCVCDNKLQEILVQARGMTYLPTTVGTITIQNCLKVGVASNSIREIRPLRKVTLANIGQLDLEVEAFAWEREKNLLETHPHDPGIDIEIINTTLPLIPDGSFQGHINSIHLTNVNTSEIRPLAFANVAKMDKIDIINCYIDMIRPKAFSKLILNNFMIEGGYIGTLASYAMNSIEVYNSMRFENVHFNIIHSSALRLTEPKKFILRSCRIHVLEGEAFRVSTKGQIFIEDNVIEEIHEGAFVGIHLDPRTISAYGIQEEYIFENNTLTKFDENALVLNTSGVKLTIDRIVLNKECSCNDIKTWSNKLVISTETVKSPPWITKLMWCRVKSDSVVVYEFDSKHCHKHSTRINWFLAGPIALLIFLLGACSLGFWWYRQRAKRYMNVPTQNNNRLSMLSQTSNIIDNLVIPQRKIYVETELNELTESVEPIKEYVIPQTAKTQEKS